MGVFDYLGHLLLREKVLDPIQWKSAKARLEKWGGRVPQVLSEMKLVDEKKMAQVLAKALRVPEVNWAQVKLIPSVVLNSVDASTASQHGVFPMELTQQGKVLVLAMSDPSQIELIDVLSRKLKVRIVPHVSTETEIQHAIRRFYFHHQTPSATGKEVLKYSGDAEFELDQPSEVFSTENTPDTQASQADEPEFLLDENLEAETPMTWTPKQLQRVKALTKKQEELHRMMSALTELMTEKGWLR